MTAILSALLFAASLSSTDVDEFFTLPSWMPTTVSSRNTPGSDPADTNGWYVVDCVITTKVNHIVNHYQISNRYESLTHYYDGRPDHYYITEWRDHTSKFSQERLDDTHYEFFDNESWNYYIVNIPTDAIHAEFRGNGRDSWPSGYEIWTNYYYATADNITTNIETKTLSWIRPCRLTPEVQAGVLSSFAGYFEREYYTSQGQSNHWDTSTWGPTLNKKRFWFDPLHNNLEFAYSPTNRTITSRRLDEYSNIKNMANHLLYLSDHWFAQSAPNRPGWIGGSGDSATMFWGTTDNNFFNKNERIVPQFYWNWLPTYSTEWGNCSHTLAAMAYDAVWRHYSEPMSDICPAYQLMKNLGFNQIYYNPYSCGPSQLSVGMKSLIETNFPHADGWAITNDTRRLMSDRLCCVNQMLSLMDRTYHVPEVVYPTDGTNTLFENKMVYNGDVNMEMRWNGEGYDLLPISGESIHWDGGTATNEITDVQTTSSGLARHHVVTPTRTTGNVVIRNSRTFIPEYGIENKYVKMAIDRGFHLDDNASTSVQLDFYGVWGGELKVYWSVFNNDTGDWIGDEESVTIEGSNIVVQAVYDYTRAYNYARTIGRVGLKQTQPGFQSYGRVTASRVGTVLGVHSRSYDINDNISSLMECISSKSTTEYESNETDYTTRQDLLDALQDDADVGYNRWRSIYGQDPFDYLNIIPLDMSDVTDVRDSIEVTGGNILFRGVGALEAHGYYSEAFEEIYTEEYLTFLYDTLQYEEGWLGLYRIDFDVEYEKDSPHQIESSGLRADEKIGAITRTDWDWKTLKRGID